MAVFITVDVDMAPMNFLKWCLSFRGTTPAYDSRGQLPCTFHSGGTSGDATDTIWVLRIVCSCNENRLHVRTVT